MQQVTDPPRAPSGTLQKNKTNQTKPINQPNRQKTPQQNYPTTFQKER